MTVENLIELVGAAAVGYGAFMGWTRSSIKAIKECVLRIEEKLDGLDEEIDDHTIQLATLPCAQKEACDAGAAPHETAPSIGFVPAPAAESPDPGREDC